MARSIFPDPTATSFIGVSTQRLPRPIGAVFDNNDNRVDAPSDTQGYLERVQNYIPAEIIAFFIFVNSLIGAEVVNEQGRILPDGWVSLATVGVGIVACVLFTRSVAYSESNPVWRVSAAMNVVAFLIWIYAIDAKALAAVGLSLIPSLSGLLLASFTLLSGFIVPSRRT